MAIIMLMKYKMRPLNPPRVRGT